MLETDKHEARRSAVAEAAARVIARDGLERSTLRAIARELNLTTSVITHYFRDKEELMIFVSAFITERAKARYERFTAGKTGLKRFERAVLAALPTDDESFLEWQVFTAFVGSSIGSERLLIEHRKRVAQSLEYIINDLKRLQLAGLIRKRIKLEPHAVCVLSLLDGFGINTVLNPEQFGSKLYRRAVSALIAEILHGLA